MRFDNYYVSEYKRVLDNIKVNEDKLVTMAENVEKRVQNAKSENTKKLIIISASAVAMGLGVCLAMKKRKQ